jgi:2-aminoethylphosphonate-pyruvate transaminase
MSSFGAVHLDLYEANISYLVSSSNKMLQGVPGFAFVIGKIAELS